MSVEECSVILVGVSIMFLKSLISMMFFKCAKFSFKRFSFKSPNKITFGLISKALSMLTFKSSQTETGELGGLYVEHKRKEFD